MSSARDASPGPEPRISVVVPHFEDLGGLEHCLDHLDRQSLPRATFEIVVADNNSPCGPAAIERLINGRARLTVVPEKGAGPARNGGVAVARGDVLAFTDSDCRPEPGWLAAGLAALGEYDFVGGAMEVLVDDADRMTPTEAFEYVFAFNNRRYVMRKGFTVTANLFCRRDLFEQVGGFRVGLSEDVEWCQRASAAGFRLGYAPEAVVGHPARKTWAELRKKWSRTNKEAFLLYTARPGGWAVFLARACLMPLSAVAHTHKVLASAKLPSFGQKLSALGVLYRLRFWRLMESFRLILDNKAN
jgi:GT2 family glycosyltransferase